MKRKTEEKIRKRHYNLKRLISLNRMIDGELSYQRNNSLYKAVAKLESRLPGLVEAI